VLLESLVHRIQPLAIIAALCGCQPHQPVVIELHLPRFLSELEIRIDTASGVAPRQLSPRSYAVDFDDQGRAVLNRMHPFNAWHQIVIVTPDRRYVGWRELIVTGNNHPGKGPTEQTPDGVVSKSQLDGTRIVFQVRLAKHAARPQTDDAGVPSRQGR